MQRKKLVLIIGAVAVCMAGIVWLKAQKSKESVRIACVGDSITFGAYLENRKSVCYPTVLQNMLGGHFQVRNFGFNGATVQNTGDRPYRKQAKFQKSLDFAPDIVLIMLGTNDTKTENWTDIDTFMKEYEAFIGCYEELPSSPQIVLMTSSAVFGNGKKRRAYTIADEKVKQEREQIIKLGKERNMQVIDIYELTKKNPQWYRLDGVHPDKEGAKAIGEYVCSSLKEDGVI